MTPGPERREPSELVVRETAIPGLYEVRLKILEDDRGSFREAWQAEKMEALGLPKFRPVQMSVSESVHGVIRGIHAEPWDKYIHVPEGRVFAALVDLRKDSSAPGTVETIELDRENALFVPRGVGNSFAVLSDRAAYTYLVTEHWRPDAEYLAVAFDDPELAIEWPIPEAERIVSDKDRANPTLGEVLG